MNDTLLATPREQPRLKETTMTGPLDGPSYSYRGARIKCCPSGHVRGLFMPAHPLHGLSFGVVGTVTALLDIWTDTGQMPRYMRSRRPA